MITIEAVSVDVVMPAKGVPVLVAGGVAMLKTGGEWFSGMEEPLFQRRLVWTPTWWAAIPNSNCIMGED